MFIFIKMKLIYCFIELKLIMEVYYVYIDLCIVIYLFIVCRCYIIFFKLWLVFILGGGDCLGDVIFV